MYAVGRLGSYITRGVYTVSGTFHPFGGAVDIIVVEQPDGSFKSSPWYVRFGKFQGVLKAREKVVSISVNGIETDIHMILDQRGEAYFYRELKGEEQEPLSYSSSSDGEMDEQSQENGILIKSESSNNDSSKDSSDQIDATNGKIIARTNSHQSRISGFIFGRRSMKEDGFLKAGDGTDVVRISSLERAEIAADLVETFMLDENDMEEKLVEIFEISRNIDEPNLLNADQDGDSEAVVPEESCPERNLDEKQASSEVDVVLPGFNASEVESRSYRVQSFMYCETSNNSVLGSDGLKEQSEETLYIASGGPEEGHFCAQTLCVTAEPVVEDTVNQPVEDIGVEGGPIESPDTYSQQITPRSSSVHGHDEANFDMPSAVSMYSTETVCTDPVLDSVETEAKAISSMSRFSNSVDQIQEEAAIGIEITRNELQPSPESVGDSEQLNGDCGLTKATSIPASESSEEEQFFFSDVDDSEPREAKGESDFPEAVGNDDHSSLIPEGLNIVNEPLHTNDESYSSPHNFVQNNGTGDIQNLGENSKLTSSPICIPKHHGVSGAEVERLAESLPNLWSNIDNPDEDDIHCSLSHSLDLNSKSLDRNMQHNDESHHANLDAGNDNQSVRGYSKDDNNNEDSIGNLAVEISLCKHLLFEGMGAEAASQAFDTEKLDIDNFTSVGPDIVKNDKLIVRIGGHYFPWDAASPIILGMVAFGSENIFEPKGMILVDRVEKSLVGDPSETVVTTSGSWRLWPFPFKRSRSRKITQPALNDTRSSDAESVLESNAEVDNSKNVLKRNVSKKIVKAVTPTSKELASLNLKEGSNEVTFTFSTSVLGKQKVDARIFLWKWNTRIVISDVDGTITKSDVLGQFMPLVGIDWSQTGVAHLFSAIKDNGYQFLYLSARAIAQAYITRQFLVNLKQDGKALPDGPVVISPDGLFPSLFREVIRRAPHEFKIACLEDIRALFPSDCNPFYAGFGNRDTDEISYLKVGIPKGKIFIINPKGEVAVNRLVDTRSYTSLHALVHGMFPAMTSSEQEDYNSWNFWKLPPPNIDM